MLSSATDIRLQMMAFFWYGTAMIVALILGYFLATDVMQIFLMVVGSAWLMLIPYHSFLAVVLSVSTFSSALIVPFFPGRPYMWELAALLGWSGLVITISLRRFPSDAGAVIARHRWLFLGIVGYCTVLIVTMFFRGFGLRVLGSDVQGGRFYFQQLSCAIFPLLFILFRVDEKMLTRLFILQCLLTATYLISDFAFSIAPKELFFLLQFFELPGDAVNFERQAITGSGMRRFQSLSVFGQKFFFLLLVFFNIREFFGKRGLVLLPLAMLTLGIGLFSGQRFLILLVGLTLFFCAYTQRFLSLRTSLAALAAGGVLLAFIYPLAGRMPLAVQRSLSVLPGIEIHYIAHDDGAGTLETRRMLRHSGMRMIPQYFWLGRGFNTYADNYSALWDPTGINAHIEQGKFYNGFIGLMINTGFPGTFFMLIFLGAGSVLAAQIMQKLREQGCEDNFSRVCCIVSGLWMANVLSFLVFHGDSEYAMKTFSLQAAILITCYWHLTHRAPAALPTA